MRIDAQSISDEINKVAEQFGFSNANSVVTPDLDEGFYSIRVTVEDPYNPLSVLCAKGMAKVTNEKSVNMVAMQLMSGIKSQIPYIH